MEEAAARKTYHGLMDMGHATTQCRIAANQVGTARNAGNSILHRFFQHFDSAALLACVLCDAFRLWGIANQARNDEKTKQLQFLHWNCFVLSIF
jgi:hypothetical protein